MSIIKGVAEKVWDNGKTKGRFGWQHRITIEVDGERYSGFFKKSADELGLEEGSFVQFSYTENGEYKNIDVKTFECSEGADDDTPPPRRSAPPTSGRKGATSGGKPTDMDRRIAIGQAVNNAIELYSNGMVKDLRAGLKTAIELRAVAEHFYDKLLAGVDVATALKAAPEQQDAAPEEAKDKPASGRKGKAAATDKAKPARRRAAPPPPPEPDPEPEQEDDAGDPEGFDDDIPFE